ncbi:hypothetical protein [Inquilinus limosus]|uniref:Uncharacterized protein n=1 Tax=Inquilinus limosus MP06 TaxID=1398085 RepID=A0A0A0CXH5_9PROT|nr:hypothetical protein [Inquilinus limosus]KGM30293.1 hypothetical protein P409_33950 [Inquilinus limosus MP06]
MDKAQPDSGPIKPSDPDLHWTEWALDRLRDIVDLEIRTMRATVREHEQILRGAEMPDFPLMQSRLARSVRLSIAMTERIRRDYLLRKQERIASGEQERRRRKREQAVEIAVKAIARPAEPEDAERVRLLVRERLVEDEILDVQLDLLSPEEFVREVSRRIGLPPDPSWLPPGWADEAATVEVVAETAGPAPAEGWPRPMDEPAAGLPRPEPCKPDSS